MNPPKRSAHFWHKTLALFFIVSLIPALVVAAVWYLNTQNGDVLVLDFQAYVLPVFILGILPAFILSFIFSELLARPVRRIHQAALDLAKGNFRHQPHAFGAGEFEDISAALDAVGMRLQQTISQTAAENSLISAERGKLRSVLNSMTDGVFALDKAGRIILFNQAASELTGRSIEEVAGQLAEKVMPFRQGGELVMTRWLASQAGSEHIVGEWKGLDLYRADGSSLFVNVQAVVLKEDPNGIAALVTFHDLTKSHQLEEMKIDFVALAAHELRTPLTEIKGYLDLLLHEAKGLTKANRDFLERAVTSANQLGGLMHNLLNVSRIEHGEMGFKPLPVNFLDFVTEVIDEMQPRAKQQHRKLVVNLPPKLPQIIADSTALREVLINLIDNAISHTSPQSGSITISVERRGEEVETSVADNGSGIPADAVPHLFTKFYRVNEMKSTTHGTGLGLFICKSIVEAHGGHIWVDSVEGEGTTFTFRLPLHPVAQTKSDSDNENTNTMRGAHGWIKNNSVR